MKKLIKFYSENCAPCKSMVPVIETVLKDTDVVLVEVAIDTDEGMDKARSLGIRSVPTFVLTEDEIARDIRIGVMNEEELSRFLKLD